MIKLRDLRHEVIFPSILLSKNIFQLSSFSPYLKGLMSEPSFMSTAALSLFCFTFLPVTADAMALQKAESQGCAKKFPWGVREGAKEGTPPQCSQAEEKKQKGNPEQTPNLYFTYIHIFYATKHTVCGIVSKITKSKRRALYVPLCSIYNINKRLILWGDCGID